MNPLYLYLFFVCMALCIIILVYSNKLEYYLSLDGNIKRRTAKYISAISICLLATCSTAFCGWYAGKWAYPVKLQTMIALGWKCTDSDHLFGFNYVGDHANWTSPILLKLSGPTHVQTKCILFLYKSEYPLLFRYYIRKSHVDHYDSSIVFPIEKYAKGIAAIEVDTLDEVRVDLGARLKELGVTIPDSVYDDVFDSITLLHQGDFNWNKWKIGAAVDSTRWVRIEKDYFVRSGGMGYLISYLNDEEYINDEEQGSFKRGATGIVISIIVYIFMLWLVGSRYGLILFRFIRRGGGINNGHIH